VLLHGCKNKEEEGRRKACIEMENAEKKELNIALFYNTPYFGYFLLQPVFRILQLN
jgi:hypothetical protein